MAVAGLGAMLGPLLAFGILALAPNDFNSIFIVSFCIALIGVGIIVLAVQGDPLEWVSHGRAVCVVGWRPGLGAAAEVACRPSSLLVCLAASLHTRTPV